MLANDFPLWGQWIFFCLLVTTIMVTCSMIKDFFSDWRHARRTNGFTAIYASLMAVYILAKAVNNAVRWLTTGAF